MPIDIELIPASLQVFKEGISTVIESFVLGDRNKFRNKAPVVKAKEPEFNAQVLGVNELEYNWKYGHAPLFDGAFAGAVDALKITGGTVWHNDAFTVLVPTAAGGLGVTATVIARNSMGSTPSANQIHWYLDPSGDAAKIANLKLAIWLWDYKRHYSRHHGYYSVRWYNERRSICHSNCRSDWYQRE